MGYLDNSTVTVDAILTKKGRELLAKGGNEFNITQFALGDDEVDYTLWNPDHPLGSDYYGVIIENMPVLEAVPDETQALRSKLITLPKNSTNIPVITISISSVDLKQPSATQALNPGTSFDGANSTLGYTAILSDNTVATLTVVQGLNNPVLSVPRFIGDDEDAQSFAVSGFSFLLTAKRHVDSDKKATITIVGNETGGSITIPVTVRKAQLIGS